MVHRNNNDDDDDNDALFGKQTLKKSIFSLTELGFAKYNLRL
jgi:hypothetical protein